MRRAAVALLALLAVSVLARLPPLINASGVHSDAATVGLQAIHLLRGEWSWFQWGAGYQSVFDSAVVAGLFALSGGPSALALMIAPLLGHLLLTAFAWDAPRRELTPWKAAWLCLPLAFATLPINGVALYAPRQWAVTALIGSVALIARGASSDEAPRWSWSMVLGGALGASALLLDLYVLQALPALAVFAVLSAGVGGWEPRKVLRALLPLLLGVAAIGAVFWLSRQSAEADAGKATITLSRLGPNFALLWGQALPFLLGYDVYVPGAGLYPDLWAAPLGWRVLTRVGAVLLGLGILSAVPLFFVRSIPAPLRNLGAFGVLACAASLAGFLLSVMPQDLWSARYLAPIVWTAPFALAPLFSRLNARGYALLAPYLLGALVAGWLNFGPYVEGPLPVRSARGIAEDEAELGRVLRERGVHHGVAQYWLAYRLTFLWREDPIVIPAARWEDRYPPYVEEVSAAPVIAYLFHPSEPRFHPSQIEPWLRSIGARFERLEVRGFTVLLHRR